MEIADKAANFIISFAEYKEQKVSHHFLWVRPGLIIGLRLLVGRCQGVCRAVGGLIIYDMTCISPLPMRDCIFSNRVRPGVHAEIGWHIIHSDFPSSGCLFPTSKFYSNGSRYDYICIFLD
jgi:hypothetical protein